MAKNTNNQNFEPIYPSPEFSTSADALDSNEVENIIRQPVLKVPRFKSLDANLTEPKEIVKFYFPGKKNKQLRAMAQLAKDLEFDLQDAPSLVPNHLSRAMVLLLKTRSFPASFERQLPAGETLHRINSVFGIYMAKIEPAVQSVVTRHYISNPSLAKDDMVAEGQIGLIKGLLSYDLTSDVDNSVFNWCYPRIFGQVTDEIRKNGYMIRRPRGELRKIKSYKEKSDNGEEISDTEKTKATDAMGRVQRSNIAYLDEAKSVAEDPYDGCHSLLDNIADPETAEGLVNLEFMDFEINDAISNLSEREQTAIKMRIGYPPYDDKDTYTLHEIGLKFGVTESMACLILKQVTPKLRKRLLRFKYT